MMEIEQLVDQLNSGSVDERIVATESLMQLGEGASSAAVALVRSCADTSNDVRECAIAALEELGPPSANDVNPLADLLGGENPDVAYWSATLLGRLGLGSVEAVGALTTALDRATSENVRERSAWALGQIGPQAENAVSVLTTVAIGESRLAHRARRAIEQIQA